MNLYSCSFDPKPDWSETYPCQPELWAYLQRTVRKNGFQEFLRLGHEVVEARWDDAARQWLIGTTLGDLVARCLIAGADSLVEQLDVR